MNMQDKHSDNIVVSVCITAYNHGAYIAQALDSILMQEVGFRYEIVVGEDCSTDNTREILLTYKEKHPDKIKLLLHDKNMGAKKNLITTLKNCSGKYIAMLDGDDYWIDSKKLQVQVDLMEKNPNCYMSFHPAEERINNAANGKVIARHTNTNKIFTTSEVILGGGGFCPTASTVFRREAIMTLTELKLYLDAPVGDYFMQIFGSFNGGALYIDKVMSVYRQGIPESWTHSMKNIDNKRKFHHNFIKSLNIFKIFLDNKYNKQYHNEMNIIISKQYYSFSLDCFNLNMFEDFKKNIELSYKTYSLGTFVYLVYYHLRFFPKLINLLRKLSL